ncbi:tyrosine-type recombinase/integrase [Cryobacterium sp. TMT3-29-2]|uniref:tyrosine-type recombinase/integrase n=1 Tax=Cryobacterium sp. TMT3-29-2 TaxID=2555867 RepID=UPI00142FA140|nr:tyrosine-type recombinase/integrase [Cryobacterium sp. TMT3-29-2]
MNAVSPPAVQRVIDNYVAVMPAVHWTTIESFVRDSVTSLGLQTRGVARNYLAATAKFAHWLWQTAAANLDPAAAFRPALIRRFVHDVMPARAETYQQQTAQRLNSLVTHFTAATPDRQTRNHPASVRPYANRDLITFRSSAARRTNEERRMNAHVLLALGAGAGMRAEEIALARVSDVSTDGDDLLVSVRGNHPRSVPLRVEWRRALATGINGREPGEWLFAGYRLPEYPARVIHQFGIDAPDEPTPSATRLRATWIVRHLNAGLRLDILLELAGLASPTSLAPYVRAMTPYDMVEVRHLISGAGPTR